MYECARITAEPRHSLCACALLKIKGEGLNKMAAQEDNESHQEFSVASFAVPSRAELEERLVLSLNTKDGQKSCAQDGADPYTKAVQYVEKHRIVEIFQVPVSMETHIHPNTQHSKDAYNLRLEIMQSLSFMNCTEL